jgi:hypothetical protein
LQSLSASWRVNCVICVGDADCQKSMSERLDAGTRPTHPHHLRPKGNET